ncbi:unnamed protein product [Cylicocyclus nassatus]|uniref:Malic enzyme n=1 Tax=Cylicocyclus nassatus TaxID=53992 RepID=A0AA36H7M8_CYLNA|nr:unnamed protein product [Cylicocyclus nassatus]
MSLTTRRVSFKQEKMLRRLPTALTIRSNVRNVTTTSQKKQGQSHDLSNPKVLALHKLYRIERVTPAAKGYAILKNPRFMKDMAFNLRERHYLGILGLLPPAVMTIEQQEYREMKRIREAKDPLLKYIFLDDLQNRNEKLFFQLLHDYVKELMPLVYTPVVGTACQNFGHIYRHPKGVYITINDNSITKIYRILSNWPFRDIRAIVVTDGERILGLGDLGAYGMGIPIGKLSLYVALGGIRPRWCLPVTLDVGTNNEKLLKDPLYTGLRKKRVRGEEYDRLVDNFLKAVGKRYGRHTLVQFEDFAFQNAFRLLDKYRNDYCTFNDDIQGTAAIILSGLITSTRVTKKKLCEQKFLFHGAGAAGLGIAEAIVAQMKVEGATEEQACSMIYMNDKEGLVTKKHAESMTPRHMKFAKDMPDMNNLYELVKKFKPNAIIGVSTQGGAFTPEIIKEMTKNNEHPIIFALSNPTVKSECTAKEAYEHSDGKALFASGSPFDDVEYKGKIYKPGQGNNSYIFPGVGLSALVWNSKTIPDDVFLIAARTCAKMTPDKPLFDHGLLYPPLENARELSIQIAVNVGEYFYEKNLAMVQPKPENLEMYVRHQVFPIGYQEILAKAYRYPMEDCKGYPVPPLPEK